MNENLFETQYDLTRKSKLKKFYEANKISIFLTSLILIIILAFLFFYFEAQKNKKILLSENYISAKIYLENGDKSKSINMLKTIIFANESTYSVLALFLIVNENLIEDQLELSNLFDHLLKNNKFELEIKNLIIFKKALLQSNYVNELVLLETIKPLINNDSLWKPHALLLLGDYFVSKKQYIKAKEFYLEILPLKNLHKEMYNQVRSRLALLNK